MNQNQEQGETSVLWTIIFIAVGLGMIALGIKFFWDKDKGLVGNESGYGATVKKKKSTKPKKK